MNQNCIFAMRGSVSIVLFFVLCFFCSVHAFSTSDINEAIRSADSSAVATGVRESPESILTGDETGRFPMHIACERGDEGIARFLHEQGSPVDCTDSKGRTPLHAAAAAGHPETVRFLIENGSPVSIRDDSGRTPLVEALLGGHRETAQLLLDHGTSLSVRDDERSVVLCAGAELGLGVVVDSLLHGLDPRDIRNENGGTFLHSVAAGGLCARASALMDSGANLIDRNIYGQTPLHRAAANGQADMIDLLLARGAYIDARDTAGFSPLHYSQAVRHDAVSRLLIARGADVSGGRYAAPSEKYVSRETPPPLPERFAPGIISSAGDEAGGVWISTSGDEIYFSRISSRSNKGSIIAMRYRNGRWSRPRPVSFSMDLCHDCSPALSQDGERLFFCSCRNNNGYSDPVASIWMSTRDASGWQHPNPLGEVLGRIPSEGGIAVSDNDCIYFPARRDDSIGSCDIYMSRKTEQGYILAENLGPGVNTKSGECCSYVDPRERFLIFASDRPGGFGSWDLYISTRNEDGTWGQAKNMGAAVNTPADERNATLSPDGSVLFFLSDRNGNLDYYWVQAGLHEVDGDKAS